MQIIIILKTIKDVFACNFVLSANHHYPEKILRIFSCKFVLAANHLNPGNIQRLFSCKIVLDANHHYPGNIQRLFPLQNCLERKSSLYSKNSKTFSPAILSLTEIIFILKIFTDFFACNNVLDANHHCPENIQRLCRLQFCPIRKSSLS